MQKRLKRPITESSINPKHKTEARHNKRHQSSFFAGFTDWTGMPILDEDYYGWLGAAGYYDNTKYPIEGPLTHDTNTTTVLHYEDMSKKKTPLDKRVDTVHPNLSQVAINYQNAELYDVQDFGEAATQRIKEKTHRILNDPIRKFQAQTLIDIQKMKGELLKNKHKTPPLNQLIVYNQMLLNVNTLLLERITDLVDLQEKHLMYNKFETKPLSKNFYAEITLKNGDAPTKLDFVDPSNNRNVPTTAYVSQSPNHNLLSLQIIFDTGTTLQFATNEPTNSLATTIKMINPPNQYTLAPGGFSIRSVNLLALDADANIRLVGLF